MWNYQYNDWNMGIISTQRYPQLSPEEQYDNSYRASLYPMMKDTRYQNFCNVRSPHYQVYAGEYFNYQTPSPKYVDQQYQTLSSNNTYCSQSEIIESEPAPKKLKLESDSTIVNNENIVNNSNQGINSDILKNDDLFHNLQLNKHILDTLDISKRLEKYFGETTVSDNDNSFTDSKSNGLMVEQMKKVYDSFIAKKEDSDIDDDLWYINNKDKELGCVNDKDKNFNEKRKSIDRSSLRCRNCRKTGHVAKFCKNPKKIPVCFICGSESHDGETCKNLMCSRCLNISHRPEDCRWHDREYAICMLCKIPGHYSEECPDLWRRYHLTTSQKTIVSLPHQTPNDRVFCYNCTSEGHFGHECQSERMDIYSYPSNPFIIDYSDPTIF